MTKSTEAEVCILKYGQILRGTDACGQPCIMIVDRRLMMALASRFRNFRYDRKEKILYLKAVGKPEKQ